MRGIVIALLCLTQVSIFAQSSTVVAGADALDSGGSVSYSIGQTFYVATNTKIENFNAGMQQPYELLFVSYGVVVIEHYSGKMLICDNHEGNYTSFSWYKDGVMVGTRNYLYEGTGLNGIYYLKVTDKEGNVYFSTRLSYTLSEVSNKSLSVYPVPVIKGEDIHVFLSDEKQKNESQKTIIRIFDSSGIVVHTQRMDVNLPLTVNTSSLFRGTYIVKVGDVSSKVIVQ